MAITASKVTSSQTLEEFRLEFNKLQSDVTILKDNPTFASNLVFEGSTADAYETTLNVVDPTADRTIDLPNSSGTLLLGGNPTLSVADDGTIGSSSDADSMTIAASGVITFSQTPVFSFDVTIEDDLYLDSDAAVIHLGEDGDVTLTHVADTGVLLNSTMKIQFNDASQFIHGSSATVLSIGATDEIDLTATAVDLNGTLDVSGTLTQTGIATFAARPVFQASVTIQDDGNIGSASDPDSIAISSSGVVTFSQSPIFSNDLTIEDDLILDSDAAVLSFGEDNEVTLTHVHNTGLLLNSTMAIQFNDSSQYINAPSNAILDINATDEIELNATLADVNANLDVSGTYTGGGLMTTGGNIVIPDAGNIGAASATSAMAISSGGIVTFADDILIKDGGTIGVASAATAITIASSGIVTLVDDLVLKDAATIGVASSTSAITIAATGIVTLVDDLVLKNAATIGVASSTGAITIASSGIVTFVDDILIKDGGTIGVASTADAMTVSSAGIVTFKDDIVIKDGGTIGVTSAATAITIASTGIVTFVEQVQHSTEAPDVKKQKEHIRAQMT